MGANCLPFGVLAPAISCYLIGWPEGDLLCVGLEQSLLSVYSVSLLILRVLHLRAPNLGRNWFLSCGFSQWLQDVQALFSNAHLFRIKSWLRQMTVRAEKYDTDKTPTDPTQPRQATQCHCCCDEDMRKSTIWRKDVCLGYENNVNKLPEIFITFYEYSVFTTTQTTDRNSHVHYLIRQPIHPSIPFFHREEFPRGAKKERTRSERWTTQLNVKLAFPFRSL